jgi:hypothetical protein
VFQFALPNDIVVSLAVAAGLTNAEAKDRVKESAESA